ncbi:aminoacyl-tRNA hydrolase [Candidatus Azambacteria bacterium]|nr:aminoacyl-tRNA hydrolase [Candidatus Azambacteria bacterium]
MDKINPKLIAGLGNPGKEYENTRHNVGFLFVDALAEKLNAPEFTYDKKLKSEISKSEILLAKPQTFMNKSGEAVSALIKYYHPTGDHPKGGKIKPENILIVHDDIDILWGDFKFSFGRSSAGHKGVESIIKALKTKNFWRLRIGIKPDAKKHISADKIILKKFTSAEMKTLDKTIKIAIAELFGEKIS